MPPPVGHCDVQRWLHGLSGLLGVDYMFQEVMSNHVGCDPDESRVMRLVFADTESVDNRMDYRRCGSYFTADGRPSDDRKASWDWAWRVERGEVDIDRSALRRVLFTTFALVLDDPPTTLRPVIADDETLTLLRNGLHARYGAGDPASPVTRMAHSLATRWAAVVATYEPPDRASAE
ncbi:hypothetical protein GCM10009557_24050 [Virgisporangium ochraceum]|uniref:Uncharacterized protein n=1 Tax=Virgisporangium ochraceum TaxID=65505 RepID=A0A8J3ZY51_9ACTN|nr:hypothetical protein [Virgisporangium ochraceum]GIJ71358.1 hypothetical protein Voc01_062750 [Virgisporangium ochraceum]